MSSLMIKATDGPWTAVIVKEGEDGKNSYALNERTFATKDQVETFLRKNYRELWDAKKVFPFDLRQLVKDQKPIGTFSSLEEADEFMSRMVPGTETKQ